MNSNSFSYYDEIVKKRNKLSSKIAIINSLAALIITIFFFKHMPIENIILLGILSLLLFFITYAFIHIIRKKISRNYCNNLRKIKEINFEIIDLRNKIEKIYSRYPQRAKGEQFKTAYKLKDKTLDKLEETLAVGMFKEKKEIFVTAFIRKNKAVRVTATIGNANSCQNSDDINKWPYFMDKLKCDEVRQYHNHPTTNNKTQPSRMDYFSSRKIIEKFESRSKFKSFIIYWNQIKEWRIMEYDHDMNYSIVKAFDIKES